jgi:hypothetical protein
MASQDIADKIRELAGIDGTIPNTNHLPEETNDSRLSDGVTLHMDGSTITVGYIAHDDGGGSYWETSDGLGTFQQSPRDRDIEENIAVDDGNVKLLVQRYSHGLDHYSIDGSKTYERHSFDVGICGVFTPCEDAQDTYKANVASVGEELAMEALIKDSNNVLDEYSSWCNGDVHGVIIQTWEVEGQHVRAISSDEVWGYIGSDEALAVLFEVMPAQDVEETIEP